MREVTKGVVSHCRVMQATARDTQLSSRSCARSSRVTVAPSRRKLLRLSFVMLVFSRGPFSSWCAVALR